MIEYKPSRDGFGKALLELGDSDDNIWVITADVSESTRTHWFADKYPKRFVQLGVAEQNMAGVASGISSCNKTVFISAFGAFSPGRNFDQIRVSICYNNSNVKIHASHTGLSVGADGASHQMLEDISMMRTLPNMVVLVPSDMEEARKATLAAAKINGPVYIRTSREKYPVFTTDHEFIIGKSNVLKKGKDVAIFACGLQVWDSLEAAKELEKQKIDASVINMHTIKPIDKQIIIEKAKECKILISVEDHQITGGLGSAIAEVLSENCNAKLIRLGVKDTFGETGDTPELYNKFGLDKDAIVNSVKNALELKK